MPHGLVPIADTGKALFAACDGEHGMELWITDGTEEGTTLAADVRPGPESGDPSLLTIAGRSSWTSAGSCSGSRWTRRAGPRRRA